MIGLGRVPEVVTPTYQTLVNEFCERRGFESPRSLFDIFCGRVVIEWEAKSPVVVADPSVVDPRVQEDSTDGIISGFVGECDFQDGVTSLNVVRVWSLQK